MEPLSPEETTRLSSLLPRFLLFALTWSLGASCDKAGRQAFDSHLRSSFKSCATAGQLTLALGSPEDGDAAAALLMPETASVYDWVLDTEDCTWRGWMDGQQEAVCDPEAPFAQIIVPTADTVGALYMPRVPLAVGMASAHMTGMDQGEDGSGERTEHLPSDSLAWKAPRPAGATRRYIHALSSML